MKKHLSILLCALLVIALFAGCNNNANPGSGDSSGGGGTDQPSASGRTDINFAITSEPKNFIPFDLDEYTGFTMCYQLYDRLIEIESDGTMTPGLAETWEIASDARSITFNLRQGVKFHNGEELTADDVVYSFNNAIASPLTSGVTSTMDNMEKLDEYTVRLNLNEAFGAIASCIPFAQLSIINKAAHEADPEGFARNPVGTGPYMFENWEIGNRITMKAFPDYYDGAASIETLNFKIILDTNTVIIALENGEIDICDTAPSAGMNSIRNNPNTEWYSCSSAGSNFIIFNCSVEPFNDARVRQAVAYALDKEAIVIGALEEDGLVAQTLMARGIFGYPDDFVSAYDEQNIEKAIELLAEAGYPNGFDIVCPTMDSELFVPATEMFQDMLSKIGINMTIEKYERNVWLDKVRIQHDYQFTHMNTNASYTDADYLYPLFHSSYIESAKNWAEANNPELDRLLEEARAESDSGRREQLYRQIVELMDEECFVAPMYNKNMGVAANAALKGVVPSATRRLFVNEYSW